MNLIDIGSLEVGKCYEVVRAVAVKGPTDWRNIDFTKYLGTYVCHRFIGRRIYDPEVEVVFNETIHQHNISCDKYREIIATKGLDELIKVEVLQKE